MQAIVRRSKGFSQSVLRVGDVELNLDSREVTVAGRPVHLTGKEYAILELLVMRKGMVLTKEVFLNHLYGGMDEPEVKIIDVFICKLRKKLAQAGAGNVIGTVWGRGYTVRDPAPLPMAAAAEPVPRGAGPRGPRAEPRRSLSSRTISLLLNRELFGDDPLRQPLVGVEQHRDADYAAVLARPRPRRHRAPR